MSRELEEGNSLDLDYQKLSKIAETGTAVVPVVVQHADTGDVLIVAYANAAALRHSQSEGVATFWSTSRDELWVKGASSGDYLDLIEIRVNCEQNSLLYRVRPRAGGVCHTRDAQGATRRSCYYRRVLSDGQLEFVD
jgi:phosphoribosyl-AMP cyclohydrolase